MPKTSAPPAAPPPQVPLQQSAFDFTGQFATHTGSQVKFSTPKARKAEAFDWDFAENGGSAEAEPAGD